MFEKKFVKKVQDELEKKINFEKSFIENNLDSLDIYTLFSISEDFYNLKFKDHELKSIKTFKDLKKKLNI